MVIVFEELIEYLVQLDLLEIRVLLIHECC